MVDGGYCADYAQLCPKGPTKCVKLSTTFIGPDLQGTPYPTVENCKQYIVPPDVLPNPNKPYYTPSPSLWEPRPEGTCEDVPFVAQGVTAKPDIYPFFYSTLPTATFPDGCDWLSLGLNPTRGGEPAIIEAAFEVGRAAAIGWAATQGYC
jgi:hypothetical protein